LKLNVKSRYISLKGVLFKEPGKADGKLIRVLLGHTGDHAEEVGLCEARTGQQEDRFVLPKLEDEGFVICDG